MSRLDRAARAPTGQIATWTLLALLGGAGCGHASDDPRQGITVTDSSGIELVRMGRAALALAPSVSPIEIFRVGGMDQPEDRQFFRLADAEEAGGEVFALDSGDRFP